MRWWMIRVCRMIIIFSRRCEFIVCWLIVSDWFDVVMATIIKFCSLKRQDICTGMSYGHSTTRQTLSKKLSTHGQSNETSTVEASHGKGSTAETTHPRSGVRKISTPNNSTTKNKDSHHNASTHVGLIIGITVPVLLLVVVIAVFFLRCLCKTKSKSKPIFIKKDFFQNFLFTVYCKFLGLWTCTFTVKCFALYNLSFFNPL